MPIAALVEFPAQPGQSEQEARDNYDRLTREFNAGKPMKRRSDWDPGILLHMAGPAPDGDWVVVDVWESEQAMGAFMERIMPVLQRQDDYVEPRVRVISVHNLVTE